MCERSTTAYQNSRPPLKGGSPERIMGECRICRGEYDGSTCQPRSMRCGHTFCLNCLQTMPSRACPMCKKPFRLEELTPNYDVINNTASTSRPSSAPAPADTKITLSVKTMNGHTHSVKINTSDQVLALKSRLFDLSGVSVDSQTVIYMGKPLENNKYMKDYKVRDGDTLQVVFRYIGGRG